MINPKPARTIYGEGKEREREGKEKEKKRKRKKHTLDVKGRVSSVKCARQEAKTITATSDKNTVRGVEIQSISPFVVVRFSPSTHPPIHPYIHPSIQSSAIPSQEHKQEKNQNQTQKKPDHYDSHSHPRAAVPVLYVGVRPPTNVFPNPKPNPNPNPRRKKTHIR